MLRSAAALIFFPFDDLLQGMVKAGQGMEALCLILGLTRDLLHSDLIRLGLPTPHDRAMRKPGPRSWTPREIRCLIWWRKLGVHPEIIGLVLGRSAASVRWKCRHLGIVAPPRKLLHKPNPNSLVEPEPGCFWRNAAPSEPASLPSSPKAACGRVDGKITWRGRDGSQAFQPIVGKTTGEKAIVSFRGSLGQRELPLFGVIGGTAKQPSENSDREIATLPRATPQFVVPRTVEEVDFQADLSGIGKIKYPLTNKVVVYICGMLLMGGLHYKSAAARVGMKERAFATFRTRAGIPGDEDHSKYSTVFDERVARETLKQSGYFQRECLMKSRRHGKKNWFWLHSRDRANIRLSPFYRKRDHSSEGRFNKITILKGRDALPPLEIQPSFAKTAGMNNTMSQSRSSAYA